MSDKPKASFDATAYWNKRYGTIDVTKSGHIDLPAEYNTWLYRRKQNLVTSAIASVGSTLKGGKFLEVAAGSGAWMNFWIERGIKDYLGIDLSERAVGALQQRFPKYRFLQRDLNDPGLPAAVGMEYDCVAAIDVLYHVTDDEKFRAVMNDLAAVLKPGGLLIIHDQFLHGAPMDHGQYIRWRSLAAYEDVLQGAGFDILFRRPTFFFMIQTVDFRGTAARAMNSLWNRVTYPLIAHFPRFSGALGYVLDSLICAVLREGPSMEVMICRKRG